MNHNGARGFSGTGLFTNGNVAAVYTVWHKFDHFIEEFSSAQYFQKQSLFDCRDGIDEECLESIAMYVGTWYLVHLLKIREPGYSIYLPSSH